MIRGKKLDTNEFTIMAHDPSFTAWGWSILGQDKRVIDCGVIKTESQAAKLRTRKGDDRIRRIREINDTLLKLVNKYNIGFHVSELPHGSQNANAAVMMGIVIGILQMLADSTGKGIEFYSENDAKKSISDDGKGKISKAQIIHSIGKLYKVKFTGTKYRDEAVADSLAIFHVALQQSELLRYFIK